MKNLKIVMAGLIALSFVACSSSSSKDTSASVKETVVVEKNKPSTDGFTANLAEYKVNEGTINTVDGNFSEYKVPNSNKTIYASMMATQGATVENRGTITVVGDNKTGMAAVNGGKAINKKGATIDLRRATNSTGMWADGSGSTVENNGIIELRKEDTSKPQVNGFSNRDKSGNYGMRATNGGKIVNHGTIKFQ